MVYIIIKFLYLLLLNLYYLSLFLPKFIILTNQQQMKSSHRNSNSKPKSKSKGYNPSYNKDRMTDASHQDDFIFNKTPILASALKKLKTKTGSSIPKQVKRPPV